MKGPDDASPALQGMEVTRHQKKKQDKKVAKETKKMSKDPSKDPRKLQVREGGGGAFNRCQHGEEYAMCANVRWTLLHSLHAPATLLHPHPLQRISAHIAARPRPTLFTCPCLCLPVVIHDTPTPQMSSSYE